jgi:uncharacterized protein
LLRFLILVFLVAAAWLVLTRVAGSSKRARADDDDSVSPEEQVFACGLCGLHVPESEGVRVGDVFYCCEAHRRQANGPGPD